VQEDLSRLSTEQVNPATQGLDRMSTLEMVTVINREDEQTTLAVRQALPQIAQAIDAIAERLMHGGRLIYTGAGTSGRLGVLDASECPPTFSVPDDLVIGLIAGGDHALRHSIEEAEDNPQAGVDDLLAINLSAKDCVVGLTASGRTPYVLGGLEYANQVGALSVGIACNQPAALSEVAQIAILLPVGPEVLSGSTRLKSGTAQKMTLNLLSTGVMVRLGKTYGNLMVDVRPSNAKLRLRARRLLMQATTLSNEDEAQQVLEACNFEVKTAIVVVRKGISPKEARLALARHDGHVRRVLEESHA
jgi:N-acetylmuramic acid 6-phosphate etherase